MQKQLGAIEDEIVILAGLDKKCSSAIERYSLDTDWGVYRFYFDNEGLPSIFGRFDGLVLEKLPPREINGLELSNYPNIYSGKMNFHGGDINNFANRMEMINAVAYQHKAPEEKNILIDAKLFRGATESLPEVTFPPVSNSFSELYEKHIGDTINEVEQRRLLFFCGFYAVTSADGEGYCLHDNSDSVCLDGKVFESYCGILEAVDSYLQACVKIYINNGDEVVFRKDIESVGFTNQTKIK
jgi:hypothetical protein